ncbi:hypothetical protein FOA24_37210 [Bacillus thuringiensis]|uniref:hypothetical protein n=1 Tax=Bacillus thuringiensis TaxID=1428 RepID=UPI0033381396
MSKFDGISTDAFKSEKGNTLINDNNNKKKSPDTTNTRITVERLKKVKALAFHEDVNMMDIIDQAVVTYEKFYELGKEKGIPTQMVIQEAIELLKKSK